MNRSGMMVKLVSFMLLSATLFRGNAVAISLKNIDVGVFKFRLDLRVADEVDYAKLDLIFLEFSELKEIIVFDGLTITNAGQTFVATKTDIDFPAAAVFLTNGVSDWIKVLIAKTPMSKSIKGTEPYLLLGDYTGNSGIDLAGLVIESIELQITYTDFETGFDPDQGSFTDIEVDGEVTIITGPIPIIMFAEAYGSTVSDYNYSIISDADGDGDVDGFDLSIFSESYGALGGSD